MSVKVAIIGASGYGGVELVRLLLNHPMVDIVALSSVSYEGQSISSLYPSLASICDDVLEDSEKAINKADVVFAALPHGLSEDIAYQCFIKNKIFIDLGADFRLTSESDYKQWYSKEYKYPNLHKESVYGLCEVNRELIRQSRIIGNPGCYPTSIALGLLPALKNDLIDCTIIIDSKSGVTGAGKSLSVTTHFPECNEGFSAYKVANHRHVPEIEETLSTIAKEKVMVTFVPHLLPVNRGILSTMYATLKKEISLTEIIALYRKEYENEYFIRVLDEGKCANISHVKCSNMCDISLHVDERNHRLIVTSAIDNMVKGAAGQAIQNMNIILGYDENTGLKAVPMAF